MSSMFHGLLPLRRRARSTDAFSSRFGDVSISAPNEGSWYSQTSQTQVSDYQSPNTHRTPLPAQVSAIYRPQMMEESNGVDNEGLDTIAFRVPVRRDQGHPSRGRSTVPKFGSPSLGETNVASLPPSTWTRKQYAMDSHFNSPRLGSMLSPVDETFAKQGTSRQAITVPPVSPEELTSLVDHATQSLNSRPARFGKHAAGLLEGTMTSQSSVKQRPPPLSETSQETDCHRHEPFERSDRYETSHDLASNGTDLTDMPNHSRAEEQFSTRPRAPSVDGVRRTNLDGGQPHDRQWTRSTSANPITRRRRSTDESLDQLSDMPPLSATSGTSYESSMKSDYSSEYAPNRSQPSPQHQTASICSTTFVVDSPQSLNSVIWQPIPEAARHDSLISSTSNESYSSQSLRHREQFAKPSENTDRRTDRYEDDIASYIAGNSNEQETRYWRSTGTSSVSSRRAASETRRPRHMYDDIERDYAQLKQDFMAQPVSPDVGIGLPRLKKKRPKDAEGSTSKDGSFTAGKLSPLLARNHSIAKESPRFGFPSPNPSLRSWATSESESRGPQLVPDYEEIWG